MKARRQDLWKLHGLFVTASILPNCYNKPNGAVLSFHLGISDASCILSISGGRGKYSGYV